MRWRRWAVEGSGWGCAGGSPAGEGAAEGTTFCNPRRLRSKRTSSCIHSVCLSQLTRGTLLTDCSVQELVDKETLTGQQIQELLTRVKGGKGSSAAPAS